MSLIFEGLKRNNHLQKKSAETASPTELETVDLPAAELLPETSPQTLEEPASITVDCFPDPQNDSVQIFRSQESDIANADESPLISTQPLEISNTPPTIRDSQNAKRIEQLRRGMQHSRANSKLKNLTFFGVLSALKSKLASGLIAFGALLTSPYKLLQFLCGTPLKSINFCSNWTILLLTKLWETLCALSSITANITARLVQLCYFVLRLPIIVVCTVGSFFSQQVASIRDYIVIGIDKLQTMVRRGCAAIGDLFFALLQCYRVAFDKILSIYLPNRWIQNATVFLLKGFAITASCCFVFVVTRNALRSDSPQNTKNSSSNVVSLSKNTTPQRKLKHFFKDPLVVKQEKVRDALLAFHIDTIQRYGNGKGQIITDNKIFGNGALLCEHPKVFLEKIGKNSLYFSDKYGQMYKRSIENMLE
ncbi:MAG: hypothetical protein LBR92_00975 [Puniceicoccales bacterium]|jgi:hypothetical protein|nr:hypothetical protein [Puniceicoccales bacterium]